MINGITCILLFPFMYISFSGEVSIPFAFTLHNLHIRFGMLIMKGL